MGIVPGMEYYHFEGGIEGTHISSLVEYTEQVENLKDWLSEE